MADKIKLQDSYYYISLCTDNLSSVFITLYQKTNSNKWNYDISVAKAITKLLKSIISIDNHIYQDLFMLALSAILLDVSNLYRNGKCLSYKKAEKVFPMMRIMFFQNLIVK